MSVEFAFQFRQAVLRSGFKDLDDVVLMTTATTEDGGAIPAGTEGTIVAVWRDGEVYTVEFAEPVGALVTVGPEDIRATSAQGRLRSDAIGATARPATP